MKCEYCDKEIKKGTKYCDFCGAKVDNFDLNKKQPDEHKEKTKKKNLTPGKIILIVFLISTIIVVAVYGLGYFICYKIDNFVSNYSGPLSEEEFDEDLEDYFYDYFDSYFDDEYSYDDEYGRTDYKGVEDFKSGEFDSDTNSYSSDFANLSFQFPTNWEVKDEKDLESIYYSQGISSRYYENGLFVYDVYAVDSFSGASFFICFYNADYFDDYDDIDDFNEEIKEDAFSYSDKYDVDYAEDSTITLNGNEYIQLAARISSSDVDYYSYDFTRYVDGYYMQISIFASDLDTVGTVIDFLNDK